MLNHNSKQKQLKKFQNRRRRDGHSGDPIRSRLADFMTVCQEDHAPGHIERVERQCHAVADRNLPALRQRRDVVVVGVLIAPGEGRGAEANDLKTRTRVSASREEFSRVYLL